MSGKKPQKQTLAVTVPILDLHIVIQSPSWLELLQLDEGIAKAAQASVNNVTYGNSVTLEDRSNFQSNQRYLIINQLEEKGIEPLFSYQALQSEAVAMGAEIHIMSITSSAPPIFTFVRDCIVKQLETICMEHEMRTAHYTDKSV